MTWNVSVYDRNGTRYVLDYETFGESVVVDDPKNIGRDQLAKVYDEVITYLHEHEWIVSNEEIKMEFFPGERATNMIQYVSSTVLSSEIVKIHISYSDK